MIFNVPNTRRNRIAALAAIALGLGVGFYISVSGKSDSGNQDVTAPVPAEPAAPSGTMIPSPDLATLPPSDLASLDFDAYSPDLSRFVDVNIGDTFATANDAILLHFARLAEDEGARLGSSGFTTPRGYVRVHRVTQMRDDSVSGEELLAVYTGPAEARTLSFVGTRLQCARGPNAGRWQTDLCP